MSRNRLFSFHAGRGEIRIGSRLFRLPQSPSLRIALGLGLIAGGALGFLPILGFWMLPLGLLVLSMDLTSVRRWRRSFVLRMERRKGERPGRKGRMK
ncbi:hypothetical protein SAMN05877838_0126 [Hoeflea halophila]|uniref:Uncharacterized protein n=1 Tax=Hoeflea halophila TaxID=714899 RepID=A0A286HKS7_9HYPH|nr:hypothetical protein [Hoeflea halophila]SOE08410.1 hypothetical protein SAMN05877838_0126 [Hoeflea halophila]